jgi:hypothetical protein
VLTSWAEATLEEAEDGQSQIMEGVASARRIANEHDWPVRLVWWTAAADSPCRGIGDQETGRVWKSGAEREEEEEAATKAITTGRRSR